MRTLRPFLFFVLLAIVLGAAGVRAQNATLRGFVTDADDGEPLQGVNVILTDAAGGLYGAATDADGLYAVRVPAAIYALRATFIGYAPYTDTLTVAAGEIVTYSFEIRQDQAALDEVVVESEREGAGAASPVAGLQAIRPQDIALIPAPDVSGDLVNYLVTLPGVVATGDQGGQLFVRGGEPTQNLVLLDGMLVYQPFHLVGFYSSFPSTIIQVTDVYAGGFPARYGGRLSSVIDVQTRNGNKRRWEGEAALAPFISAARVEGPVFPGRASVLLSGRFSVIDQGAAKLIDDPLPYAFDDQFAKLHVDLTANSQLSVTALRSYDKGVIGVEPDAVTTDSTTDDVIWRNRAAGARYLLLPTALPVQAEILFSFSEIENTFGDEDDPLRASAASQYNVAANVTHFLGASDVSWGLYVRSNDLESELGGAFQGIETDREFVTEAGAYVETELSVGEGLRIEPGLHVQSFPSKGRTFIEPRVRAVYERGAHRLSAAAGIYHQEIVGLTDRRDAGDVFTAWTTSPLGEVPEAIHAIAGYQVRPFGGVSLSIEGYYKRLSNLSIAEWTAFPRFTTGLQPADGTVYGGDARVEFASRRFYGFVNYGYSEVEYEARDASVALWFGTPSLTFSPPHDRRHQVNALASLRFFGFDLSTRWQYGSGLPFSEAVGFDEFVLLDGPTDVLAEEGETRVLYGAPYTGRLPDYHRLDVSLERTFTLGPRGAVTLLGSLTNAYDRTNLFYVDLFTLRRLNQLPLIPSVGVKLAF